MIEELKEKSGLFGKESINLTANDAQEFEEVKKLFLCRLLNHKPVEILWFILKTIAIAEGWSFFKTTVGAFEFGMLLKMIVVIELWTFFKTRGFQEVWTLVETNGFQELVNRCIDSMFQNLENPSDESNREVLRNQPEVSSDEEVSENQPEESSSEIYEDPTDTLTQESNMNQIVESSSDSWNVLQGHVLHASPDKHPRGLSCKGLQLIIVSQMVAICDRNRIPKITNCPQVDFTPTVSCQDYKIIQSGAKTTLYCLANLDSACVEMNREVVGNHLENSLDEDSSFNDNDKALSVKLGYNQDSKSSRTDDVRDVEMSPLRQEENSVSATTTQLDVTDESYQTCTVQIAITRFEFSLEDGVPRLFKRYWGVTVEMFEGALRSLSLVYASVTYVIFHHNDVRLPLYIPTLEGSYLSRKEADYIIAYQSSSLSVCTYLL